MKSQSKQIYSCQLTFVTITSLNILLDLTKIEKLIFSTINFFYSSVILSFINTIVVYFYNMIQNWLTTNKTYLFFFSKWDFS